MTAKPNQYTVNENYSAKVYTLVEAATLLKVHTITIRRLIKRRLLRRVAAIRDIRIPAEDVDHLIQNNFSLGSPSPLPVGTVRKV